MEKRILVLGAAVALVVVAGLAVVVLNQRAGDYALNVVMPSAQGIVDGTPVQIGGQEVGRVSAVAAKGDQAVVTAGIDSASAPLRAGTTVTVEWRSLLGERYLNVQPGPAANPQLPSGAMIPAGSSQVVVEDLLEALTPDTRVHLTSLVQQLDTTLKGQNAQNLNDTLHTAGPAVQALGSVLGSIGEDGAAIRTLVTNLHGVTQILAERKDGLSSSVSNLTNLTETVANQQQQLTDSLQELPGTVDALQTVFDKFPAATDQLVPLLDDLKPAAARLPGVAANLSPVLQDLRPTVGLLKPTLQAADQLLGQTPGFLDQGTAVLPQVQTAVQKLGPAVSYLRPYTPEVMGFVSNWGNLFSTYDSQGHFANPLVVQGKTGVDNNPNVLLPGENNSTVVQPGEIVGQTWTDANGSAPR